MVTTFHTPESQEARCPSCGAAIKVPGRRRRVQCPKCREVITLAEADLPPRPLPKPPPPVAAPDDEPARLDAIETRIAAIEARPASEAGGTPAIDSLEQRIVALEDASKALITAARAGAEAPARPSAEPAPRPCIEITPTFDSTRPPTVRSIH